MAKPRDPLDPPHHHIIDNYWWQALNNDEQEQQRLQDNLESEPQEKSDAKH